MKLTRKSKRITVDGVEIVVLAVNGNTMRAVRDDPDVADKQIAPLIVTAYHCARCVDGTPLFESVEEAGEASLDALAAIAEAATTLGGVLGEDGQPVGNDPGN